MNEMIPYSTPAWAIEVQGLSKSFGNYHALKGIDLRVGRGERLSIFGPNGAGKTTLIKIIATLTKPSVGNVRLDGTNIRDKPVQIKRKVGLVGHQTFLYDSLTIYENLKFYGKMYDVPNLEQQIREVVAWVQLEHRLHDRVGTLSRGMQQRVSLARAVLHNPSIILLDEPEVGLDPHAITIIRDILGAANCRERTVIMTTHNLERGLELGDKVVILNRGKLVYQALKHEIDTVNFLGIYNHYTGISE